MAKRIPEQIIEEIKAKSDIVDVVSSYVSLTQKSRQNLFGLCPFHHEKTPSFSVSPQKQIYYCFGCHKGGDVIHFVMDIEHLRYPEAVRFLGQRCGIEVPEDGPDDDRYRAEKEKRERLYALNTEAARYFYQCLQTKEASEARAYMQKRGISRQMAISFGLGYAPDRWQGLLDHLRSKRFTEEEIKASGLFKVNRKGGLFDLFRHRLMFPIIDVMGRIVAFGGRVLDDSNPKYLNSPETPIYTKGRHLYGLNLAKKSRENRLLVVEGYMDCLSLHQAGIDHAVASLGTALTEQQAQLLRKYREEIVLGYDMDNAGRQAALRNVDVLEEKGAKAFVLQLPGAKDPDDYIREHSADEFRALLDEAPNGLDYKFIYVKNRATQDGKLNKLRYQEGAAKLLLSIRNPVVRALYIPKVAAELNVPEESVQALLQMRRDEGAGKKVRRQKYTETKQDPADASENGGDEGGRKVSFTEREAVLISLLCRYPEVYKSYKLNVRPEWFEEQSLRPLVGEILRRLAAGELSEQLLLMLINEQGGPSGDLLASQFGQLFMRDEPGKSDEEIAKLMRRHILLLRSDYYNRLSQHFSRLLDKGPAEQEAADLRRKFKAVLQARQKCELSLRELDSGPLPEET